MTDVKAIRPEARWMRGAAALVLACSVAAAFLMPPEGLPFLSCRFHDFTGVSCLTCGLTRSLHAATHGNLLAALQYHLLGPLLLGGVIAGVVVSAVESSTGRRVVLPGRILKRLLLVCAILWIGYGVLRAVAELLG